MSAELLERVKAHIVDDGGLLGAYSVRYYGWTDTDLNGSGSVALFRTTGTGGESNHQIQQPDVSLFLLADPDAVRQADSDMLAVKQYLRANYKTVGAYALSPVGPHTGPTKLINNRSMFELVIRVGVEDH